MGDWLSFSLKNNERKFRICGFLAKSFIFFIWFFIDALHYLPFLNQTAKRSVSDFGEFFLVYNFYGLKGIAPIIWDSLKDEILPRALPFLAVILFWFFFSYTRQNDYSL